MLELQACATAPGICSHEVGGIKPRVSRMSGSTLLTGLHHSPTSIFCFKYFHLFSILSLLVDIPANSEGPFPLHFRQHLLACPTDNTHPKRNCILSSCLFILGMQWCWMFDLGLAHVKHTSIPLSDTLQPFFVS